MLCHTVRPHSNEGLWLPQFMLHLYRVATVNEHKQLSSPQVVLNWERFEWCVARYSLSPTKLSRNDLLVWVQDTAQKNHHAKTYLMIYIPWVFSVSVNPFIQKTGKFERANQNFFAKQARDEYHNLWVLLDTTIILQLTTRIKLFQVQFNAHTWDLNSNKRENVLSENM